MANWKDAYETQMDLWKWARSGDGKNQMLNTVNFHQIPESSRPLFLSLIDTEEDKLLGADPIFVAEEFCDLCEQAQEGFQPEVLLASDFITSQGFVYFEKPILIPTKDPAFSELLAGFSWTPLMGSLVESPEEGDWFPGGVTLTLYAAIPDERRDARYEDGKRFRLPPIAPFHLTPWYFDMTFDGNEVDVNGEETSVDVWWRLCQVTLRLMQQKLTARTPTMVDRSSRRRGQRIGFAPRETVIVRLRRHKQAPTNGESNVQWTHRWASTWYWRNTWYPSLGVHRQQRVAGSIKGPEGLPLILKGRAYQWEE